MENQVNDVENLRNAMEGMAVKVMVAVNPTKKDLLQIGGVVALGSVLATAGTMAISGWWERRKYKKHIEKINEQFKDL